MNWNWKSSLVILSRLVLGVVFIYASVDKIAHPADFAKAVGNYHLLPWGLENFMGLILPWLELLTGIALITGIMVDGSVLLITLMMIMFIAAISLAMARGIDIECGCFSVSEADGAKVGFRRLFEDFIYLGLALVIMNRRERLFEFFPKSD
ncbi:MAG: MauE/DoxX family redox-associated membrane protein [Fidelibacterota bacterium]